jgi:hypothetical protein
MAITGKLKQNNHAGEDSQDLRGRAEQPDNKPEQDKVASTVQDCKNRSTEIPTDSVPSKFLHRRWHLRVTL